MKRFITVGTYDGVHRGHRKIIETVMKRSAALSMESGIVFFPVSPKFYFEGVPENCLITLPREREEMFKNLGLESIFKIVFNSKVAKTDAKFFFREILCGRLNAGGLCVGKDFTIGRNKSGNLRMLRKLSADCGVHFTTIPFVRRGGAKISSSLVRKCLLAGDVKNANEFLGWNYFVSGKVVKGAMLGRKLGFPTANMETDPLKIIPPGVFVVRVSLGGKVFAGVANAGVKPTMGYSSSKLLLEAHILDFDRMIYGENLRLEFLARVRGEKKFSSKEELQKRILGDIFFARRFFERKTKREKKKTVAGRGLRP